MGACTNTRRRRSLPSHHTIAFFVPITLHTDTLYVPRASPTLHATVYSAETRSLKSVVCMWFRHDDEGIEEVYTVHPRILIAAWFVVILGRHATAQTLSPSSGRCVPRRSRSKGHAGTTTRALPTPTRAREDRIRAHRKETGGAAVMDKETNRGS